MQLSKMDEDASRINLHGGQYVCLCTNTIVKWRGNIINSRKDKDMSDDRKCRSEDCEAHLFMVETMKELKVMNSKLMESQQRLSEASVKLTENILEIHRTNDKLDDVVRELRNKDTEQDKEIESQRAFTNRALGALALITFLSPFILYLLTQN